MKINIHSIQDYLVFFILIMLVLSAGILPIDESIEKNFVKLVSLLLLIVYLSYHGVREKTLYIVSTYFLIVFVFTSINLPRTFEWNYALQKMDAIVFCVPLAILIIDSLLKRNSAKELAIKYVNIWLLLLFFTILYKLQFGFFDRNVRFFINGANVFGWMMGLATLISFLLFRCNKWFFLYFVFFLTGVFWSQSKGALIATIFCLFFVFFCQTRWVTKIAAFLSSLLVFLSLDIIISFLERTIPDSRLFALVRLVTGQLDESDQGSIGIRQELYNEAYSFFVENPVVGIGLGNFKYFSILGFDYPHNAHLEVFAEMGAIIGITYLIFLLLAFFFANTALRGFIVFFFIVTSFSGDIGYLRFLFIAILAVFAFNKITAKTEQQIKPKEKNENYISASIL